ncbi:MAG: hypothetical protein K6U89_18660 [Chloroflexi bacterium]|jgi:hypothetical protein|nr:hypothetical protein [Chloroflexota bacterium]
MSARRGGLPGPESRTSLTRPAMSEAEFERRLAASSMAPAPAAENDDPGPAVLPVPSLSPGAGPAAEAEPPPPPPRAATTTRSRTPRGKAAKVRRVERMFAIEEDLDKKLWLYAIHVGKDRSEVVNDLLRPVVSSMVLYDSRDRRAARAAELDPDPGEGA